METEHKTVQQIIAESDKRLRETIIKAEAKRRDLTAFSGHWPIDRLVTHIHTGLSDELGRVHVSAEVEGRAAALEYLKAFDCLPQVFIKGGGFAMIRAREWTKQRNIDNADIMVDALGAYWSYDDYWHAQLHAFTLIGGQRTQIVIKIKADGAFRQISRTTGSDESRIKAWTLRGAPGGEAVTYASGTDKSCGNVSIYFPAEPGGAAPDLAYYMDMTRPVEWRSRY